MEVSKVIREHEIPLLTTYPTNPRVPENSDFVFMTAYTDPYQANIMANFAIQELNAATAATLTEINSSYSQGLTEVFVEAFTAAVQLQFANFTKQERQTIPSNSPGLLPWIRLWMLYFYPAWVLNFHLLSSKRKTLISASPQHSSG